MPGNLDEVEVRLQWKGIIIIYIDNRSLILEGFSRLNVDPLCLRDCQAEWIDAALLCLYSTFTFRPALIMRVHWA